MPAMRFRCLFFYKTILRRRECSHTCLPAVPQSNGMALCSSIEGNLVDDTGELHKLWAIHWLAVICVAGLNWQRDSDVTTSNSNG
jgi:hypothetical protein